MKQILNNNSGMALLVTLAVISILLTLALHLARITGQSVMATGRDKTQFLAQEMAISGIHLAMAILADDAGKNEIDSLQEDWADPEKISQAVNQLGYSSTQDKPPPLSLKITDELGKLQVNALLKGFPGHELNPDQSLLWENLLKIATDKPEDPQDPSAIINALKDWLDSGDDDAITGLSGAESDYYLQLDPPYAAGNGPFNQVSQVLNVKGISLDLKQLFQEVLTVYGLDDAPKSPNTYGFSGNININTARVEILAALLPRGLEDQAEDLVGFRQEKTDNDDVFINILDKGWYEKVIKLPEKEKKRFDRMIRYNSTLFRADCTARVDNVSVMVSAVIKRERAKQTNQWVCRIIQLTKE
jgi:general secretion pathway protein K